MNTNTSITPLCGRYSHYIKELSNIFNDAEYYLERLKVEIAYLSILLNKKSINMLLNVDYNINTFNKILEIEKITNHDVKAIEYYIRTITDKSIHNYIHCGLTSQDINSVGFILMIENCRDYFYNLFSTFQNNLDIFKNKFNREIIMTYTHGRPAVPSYFDIELDKLIIKIKNSFNDFLNVKLTCKFSSSIGTYSTLSLIFNEEEIVQLYQELSRLLNRKLNFTTYARQIDDYSSIIILLQIIQRISLNLKEFALNIWLRITRDELIQENIVGHIGSSVMAHKINPWRLEQVEASSNIIYNICDAIIRTIGISKDSRDMSDSYALRNIGEIFANLTILIKNIEIGIKNLQINKQKINTILNENITSLSEYFQTYLRWNCDIEEPYKLLEDLTKGRHITYNDLHYFIDNLNIDTKHKEHLKNIKIEDIKIININ
jgi:adenylosuccinate lyase